ncbi:hypothetical protein C8F01DRAFT_1087730 [Mycena amicta]|nr:hypothetical protein C8F01DRAFT_1087730 [Mycena amicta]
MTIRPSERRPTSRHLAQALGKSRRDGTDSRRRWYTDTERNCGQRRNKRGDRHRNDGLDSLRNAGDSRIESASRLPWMAWMYWPTGPTSPVAVACRWIEVFAQRGPKLPECLRTTSYKPRPHGTDPYGTSSPTAMKPAQTARRTTTKSGSVHGVGKMVLGIALAALDGRTNAPAGRMKTRRPGVDQRRVATEVWMVEPIGRRGDTSEGGRHIPRHYLIAEPFPIKPPPRPSSQAAKEQAPGAIDPVETVHPDYSPKSKSSV